MDIIITQFPSKTMEIAPLGASILIGDLKKKGYICKQYDFNVMLKDELLSCKNVNYLCNTLLPKLYFQVELKKNKDAVKGLYSLLKSVEKQCSFESLEMVKKQLQSRNYIDVFNNETNTKIFEQMLNILTFSNDFFELIICNEVIEREYSDLFVFKFIDKYLQEIVDYNPKIIGFSVVQMQRKFSLWAAKRLRDKFNYKGIILFGGSDVTYYKEKYLEEFSYIDYLIYQEGENSIDKLIEYTNGNGNLKSIPNLIYKVDDLIITNNANAQICFDDIEPDFTDLDLSLYLSNALPMQISRGCSWGNCTYCKHFRTYGKKYYTGNINKLIDIIENLMKKYNTELFHFVDDDFPLHLKNEFSDEIINRNLSITWLTYSRLDSNISKNDLGKWYKAGLRVIEWGLESASQNVLNSVNKGIEVDNIKRILMDANDIGFLNKIFMFHNLPEEGYEDIYTSIMFLKKFVSHKIVRHFWEISTPLELLEGTPLYDESMNDNIFKKVFLPQGKMISKADYIHLKNYNIKKSIFNNEFIGIEDYYKSKGVLNVNDEAIMFDVIIEELSKVHDLYAKVRL